MGLNCHSARPLSPSSGVSEVVVVEADAMTTGSGAATGRSLLLEVEISA